MIHKDLYLVKTPAPFDLSTKTTLACSSKHWDSPIVLLDLTGFDRIHRRASKTPNVQNSHFQKDGVNILFPIPSAINHQNSRNYRPNKSKTTPKDEEKSDQPGTSALKNHMTVEFSGFFLPHTSQTCCWRSQWPRNANEHRSKEKIPLSLAKGPGNKGSFIWNASGKAEREAGMPRSDLQVTSPPPLLAGVSEESQWRVRTFTNSQGHEAESGETTWATVIGTLAHPRVASAEADKWSSLLPHPRVKRQHCPPLISPLAEASCQTRFN